jgi:hypothetical protein
MVAVAVVRVELAHPPQAIMVETVELEFNQALLEQQLFVAAVALVALKVVAQVQTEAGLEQTLAAAAILPQILELVTQE